MSNDSIDVIDDISNSIQQLINEQLRTHRFIHCKSADVSYGLPFDIKPYIEKVFRQFQITNISKISKIAKIPKSSKLPNIQLTKPPDNKLIKRIEFSDNMIEYMLYSESTSKDGTTFTQPFRIIHPHEYQTYDIKDDIRLVSQRVLVNEKCKKCKDLFLENGIKYKQSEKTEKMVNGEINEFVISTLENSYKYIQAIEIFAKIKNFDISVIRTEREPFPGIVVRCSRTVVDQLVAYFSWVTKVKLSKEILLELIPEREKRFGIVKDPAVQLIINHTEEEKRLDKKQEEIQQFYAEQLSFSNKETVKPATKSTEFSTIQILQNSLKRYPEKVGK